MNSYNFLEQILQNLSEKSEANSFFIGETFYTYGELASSISEVQKLTEPYSRETHVGVYLSDDIETYASILALWMSGRAFVPINPQFPWARNRNIMKQLELKVLLHSVDIDTDQIAHGCKTIYTGDMDSLPKEMPSLSEFKGESDAYVLFTSGSTGVPKGVRISFNNLNAFVRDFIGYPAYAFSSEDRFLQIYDLSFDASVHCYTVPLAVGACTYTIPPGDIKYLAAYKIMEEQELTFVKMPPSTLSFLRPYFPSIQLPDLKYCLLGGEAFPSDLVNQWESSIPNALVQNVYGPTEVTINCLIYDWNGLGGARKQVNGTGAIGRGFGSNRILIMTENGKPAGVGETGELLVAGEQVSPGYWNNEELNQKAFVDIVYEGKSRRYYRTGDVVSMDDQGDVMYHGRNDEQVQVQGYRVELGEIESVARDYLGGLNVMAFGREKNAGEMTLVLAIESEEKETGGLKDHLMQHMPPYMIPEKILCVKHFPRQISGKLDRRAINELIES
jgi:D-alanine--poly(phosphoribitol) ligase subunit 1